MIIPLAFQGRGGISAVVDEESGSVTFELNETQLKDLAEAVDQGWVRHLDISAREGMPRDFDQALREKCLARAQDLHKTEDFSYIVHAANEYYQYLINGVKRPSAGALTSTEDHGYGWAINKDIETCVYEAVGAASMTWEHVERAGVFQDAVAKEIADQLLNRIRQGQLIDG